MNTIDRGKGICPICRAPVRLVRFRGSTADRRDGSSVIGRHHTQLQPNFSHCKGEQQLPVGGES